MQMKIVTNYDTINFSVYFLHMSKKNTTFAARK
jgi:hypothetical protein